VEGYRNLLVHGPLTVVLMLSALRARLRKGEIVLKFDYRNLAPLYAGEEMRVCVKRDPEKAEKFDVWIEGKEGGYAVKGIAIAGMMDPGAKSRRRSKVPSTTEGPTS
jgi:hydroxyacyl-ACP dehydratase HTD2-like protein with hotdog domain